MNVLYQVWEYVFAIASTLKQCSKLLCANQETLTVKDLPQEILRLMMGLHERILLIQQMAQTYKMLC
jgi:hypothetical protein